VEIVTGTPDVFISLFSSASSRKLERKCHSLMKITSFQIRYNSSLLFIRSAVFQTVNVVRKEGRMWVKEMSKKSDVLIQDNIITFVRMI